MIFFRSTFNIQIFTVNITRVVWHHVTNKLDLRYFCRHNPLFYYPNLIPCHYWSWQSNIYILVNIFVGRTFPMSKSNIKTKTVLTMTDSHAIIYTDTNAYLPFLAMFVSLKILEYMPFLVANWCFSGSEAVKSGFLLQRYWNSWYLLFRQESKVWCSGNKNF